MRRPANPEKGTRAMRPTEGKQKQLFLLSEEERRHRAAFLRKAGKKRGSASNPEKKGVVHAFPGKVLILLHHFREKGVPKSPELSPLGQMRKQEASLLCWEERGRPVDLPALVKKKSMEVAVLGKKEGRPFLLSPKKPAKKNGVGKVGGEKV